MKRYSRKGGSTYAHRLARRTRNTFRPVAKFLVPLVNKFGPQLIDMAMDKIAGKGRKYTRGRSGRGFFGDLAKKAAKKYAPNAINMLANKAKSYVGDNSLASQLIDKGAMMAQNKVAGSGRRKSMRHMLKYTRHKRMSRKRMSRRCGGALYGSALMPAGYGMSRSRRGRGLKSRMNRSFKKIKSVFGGSRKRYTRGRGTHSGLVYPRG
jgi:hypothetical protein